jgi:hypothetical protein
MEKRRVLSFLATAIAVSQAMPVLAVEPLQGKVKSTNLRRVTRPLQSNMVFERPTLNSSLEENTFRLKAVAMPAQASDSALGGAVATSYPLIQSGTSQPSLNPSASSNILQGEAEANKLGSGSKAPESPKYDSNTKPPLSGSVTFRFCYYDLGDGAECAWEGLRDALYLQGRGVDIALMLDRGGVRLANKHNAHEYQLHRGSTERLVATQKMLREFIDKGGEVYASERWSRTFGLTGGSYPAINSGVKLLGDEEMAELLVDRSGRIVEY